MDAIAIAASGMRQAVARLDGAAARIARGPVESIPAEAAGAQPRRATGDAGGPIADLVQAREAVLSFEANARMMRTADQAVGFLLDVVA